MFGSEVEDEFVVFVLPAEADLAGSVAEEFAAVDGDDPLARGGVPIDVRGAGDLDLAELAQVIDVVAPFL